MSVRQVSISVLVWTLASAAATPTFTGEPRDVAIARAAWQAAEACTGRPGKAAREVAIVHRTIPGGYLGVAHTQPDGTLVRIDLNTDPDRHREVLVHEVAHAWISSGPTTLVEGTAELLGDCMVGITPGLATLQFDDGRELTGLVDLRNWSTPDAHSTEALGAIRTDAYIGASRLMRTAALILPERALWADQTLTWERFDSMLEAAGPRGIELRDTLLAGAAAQREALADRDLDGLPALGETFAGTRDDAFDTDGDGWWDGAHAGGGAVPVSAVAVPLDGSPVCSGWAAAAAGTVHVYAGGNMRGHQPPRVVARAGSYDDNWAPTQPDTSGWGTSIALMPAGASLLLQLDRSPTYATGAAWARVAGQRLTEDSGCSSSVEATVWAHDRALISVIPAFSELVHKAIEDATARFGPAPARVSVALGGERSTVVGPIVWMSTRDVAQAQARGKLRELAYLAVSVHHLYTRGERDWRAGEALSRAMLNP